NTAWGGFGTSGLEGDAEDPGNWFWHHNLLDLRQERHTNWNAQPHPHFVYAGHSPDGRSPKKIYNNLVIFGPDTEEETSQGFQHAGHGPSSTSNTYTSAELAHEVFNNIFARVYITD